MRSFAVCFPENKLRILTFGGVEQVNKEVKCEPVFFTVLCSLFFFSFFSPVTRWSPGHRCSAWSSPAASSSQQTCWVRTALWLVSGTSLASWRWWSPLTSKTWALKANEHDLWRDVMSEQRWRRSVSVSGEQQHHPGSFRRLRRLPVPQTGHRTDGVSCCQRYLLQRIRLNLGS